MRYHKGSARASCATRARCLPPSLYLHAAFSLSLFSINTSPGLQRASRPPTLQTSRPPYLHVHYRLLRASRAPYLPCLDVRSLRCALSPRRAPPFAVLLPSPCSPRPAPSP